MGLFTVLQIRSIIAQNKSVENEIQRKTYEALIDKLHDDHVINMNIAFVLH